MVMYRFRTVSNLIGEFQELQKQQIYFAHPEQLNDPMEGMRRYFWRGDEIVWRNLLKHYLLCLEHVVTLARLTEENEQITKDDIPIYKSLEILPTDLYRERIQEVYEVFFSNRFVQSYLSFIIKNPYKIYSEELYVHLKFLFRYALNAVFEVDAKHGFIPTSGDINELKSDKEQADAFFTIWEKISELPDGQEMYEHLMKAVHEVMKEMDFQHVIKLNSSIKMQNIYVEFPQMYIEAIKALTYPEAYIACFMDNCTNSSIWGTYGDNHRGVCLKYKIKDQEKPTLKLKTITGFSSSGNTYGTVEFPLKKMIYSNEFDELDFFRNIGRLPVGHLERQWYTNEKGERSICSEHLFSNKEEWRGRHWESFETAYLNKLPAWSHEREYRIILSSVLEMFSESKDRLLEYNFEDLEAIIFGINTPKEDRIKIIEIVNEKCKKEGRKQFDFYEMAYSNIKQEMDTRKILSLKL